MSSEQPQQHSENYGLQDEALEMLGELTVLPLEILGELAESAFDLD